MAPASAMNKAMTHAKTGCVAKKRFMPVTTRYSEQADARRVETHHDVGIGRTHDAELHQIAGVALGIRTEVEDPLLAFIRQQQPRDAFNLFQRQAIDALAQHFIR